MKVQGKILAASGIFLGAAAIVVRAIAGGSLSATEAVSTAEEVTRKVVEPYYAGIPLSKYDEIAKSIPRGIKCVFDHYGYPVFHYRSNRGHHTFHQQMHWDSSGKMMYLGGHFPGQIWSAADEFAKKVTALINSTK